MFAVFNILPRRALVMALEPKHQYSERADYQCRSNLQATSHDRLDVQARAGGTAAAQAIEKSGLLVLVLVDSIGPDLAPLRHDARKCVLPRIELADPDGIELEEVVAGV